METLKVFEFGNSKFSIIKETNNVNVTHECGSYGTLANLSSITAKVYTELLEQKIKENLSFLLVNGSMKSGCPTLLDLDSVYPVMNTLEACHIEKYSQDKYAALCYASKTDIATSSYDMTSVVEHETGAWEVAAYVSISILILLVVLVCYCIWAPDPYADLNLESIPLTATREEIEMVSL